MKHFLITFFIFFYSHHHFGQKQLFDLNEKIIYYNGEKTLNYNLNLEKSDTYLISVFQENIDVEVMLKNSTDKSLVYTDLADENKGFDKLEFSPEKTGDYILVIKSVSPKPVPNGIIKINIRKLSKTEITRRDKIKKELESENLKTITTIDIQHFWEAYDELKNSKNYQDSVKVVQEFYLDRGTDGLKEFQKVRYFAAEFYVERIKRYRKFYESVRDNTLLFNKSENFSTLISEIKRIYPEGKSAKIAFVVGPMSTGGTISNNYLLIGIEMLSGDKNCNVSEITNENLKFDILSRSNQQDVLFSVEETVAHEYIHTQQKEIDKNSVQCSLLESVLKEGIAAYIAEKLIMKREKEVQSRAAIYTNENEKHLWSELKNELCSKDVSNWLYNASKIKDRPGDLGYRIGYKIAESFYENAANKKLAIKKMIEMDNPLLFLDKSKYDLKFR